MEQRPSEWGGAAMMQPAQSAAPDMTVYLHGLRRHWLQALGFGILCAAIVGPAVWFGVGKKYVASSFLRVAMQDSAILTATTNEGVDRDFFEIYKNTQQQLVTSRFVLLAALRKPEVVKLASVQDAAKDGDAVEWLKDYLSVTFPGRAEIMEISVTRKDPEEAATLTRAVMDAYLNEVVNAERDKKRQHFSDLDRACIEKETEIRSKREDLKKLAKTVGTSDADTLNVQQKIALELLSIYRQDSARTQYEVRKLESELAAANAVLKSLDDVVIDNADVEMLVMSDPIAKQLFMELGWRKMQQIYTSGAVVAEAKSSYADRYQQDLQIMQQQYDDRRAELAELVKQKKRSEIMTEIKKNEAFISVMSEQEKSSQKLVDDQLHEAEKIGISSVDVEMMRADIKNLDAVMGQIVTEREKLRVEIRSAPRITAPYGKADVPIEPSNRMPLIVMTIMAMFGCACIPAAIISFLDVQTRRINNSTDVSKGLSLSVIGSIPLIPQRVIRKLGSPSKRNRMWHMRLTESVDGIAARILRKADTEQCRVIMVSSAIGGEGKTTLATQLAMSLARVGRQTVLVDFDLRRPSFDEVFGLPLEPGVCEALRRENPVSALVHQIPADNLAVVTAGRWDRTALASLSNGSAAAMFKQLREDFEFVVIDTSPILPVADARFVSQHVDSVVLSVFRDISEAPKIEAACEILTAFGVNTIEAVVTGPNDRVYGKHMGYESTISA
jgi:capsular exopolysaccharide synthesis family protein